MNSCATRSACAATTSSGIRRSQDDKVVLVKTAQSA